MIPEDAGDDRAHENPRESSGRPGTRAPHIWLKRNRREISTLDLFGGNFVLLTAGAESNAWCERAQAAAQNLRVALDIDCVGADLADPSGGFAAAYGIAPTGAALVRPDGFVAWRAKSGGSLDVKRIESVLATLLARR